MSTQPTPKELQALAESCGIGWAKGLGGMDGFLRDFARAVLERWGTPATGGEPVAWIRFQPPYRPDVLVQRHRPTLDGEPDTQYRPLVFGDTSPQPVQSPIAWRYRMAGDLQWQYTERKEQFSHASEVEGLTNTQPVRKPLSDEQIKDLIGFGDPTEQEKHLIRMGFNAAHGISITGGQT